MFIVDGHEDIAMNALQHGRDVRLSVAEIREAEAAREPDPSAPHTGHDEAAMVGLPEHRRGGVGLVFSTIFTLPDPDPAVPTEKGLQQLLYYHDLARQPVGVRLITDVGGLDALIRDWELAPTVDQRPTGFMMLMEGADPVSKPSELHEWVAGGVRMIGLAWKGTRYAGGTGQPGPLTPLGRDLLREMSRQGVILDMSHIAEESFWQAMERFDGTVVASHSNCRVFVPTDRQLTDAMIHAIAERDGVIGTVMANRFLVADWQPGQPVTLDVVIRHMDHVCQLTGSAKHCAIGTDFDGGFGVPTTPDDFDSVADLGKLGDALAGRGYSTEDIAGIMGQNWIRVLRRGLPGGAS